MPDWYEQGYHDYQSNRSYVRFSKEHQDWAAEYEAGWKQADREHHQFLRTWRRK